MRATILILPILLVALSYPSAAAPQNYDTCNVQGRYCFANTLYECVNGEPRVVEECSGPCENAACVDMPLAPNIPTATVESKSPALTKDFILQGVLVTTVLVVILLFVRIKLRKPERAED